MPRCTHAVMIRRYCMHERAFVRTESGRIQRQYQCTAIAIGSRRVGVVLRLHGALLIDEERRRSANNLEEEHADRKLIDDVRVRAVRFLCFVRPLPATHDFWRHVIDGPADSPPETFMRQDKTHFCEL